MIFGWDRLSTVKRVVLAFAAGLVIMFLVWTIGSFFGIFTSWHDRKFDKSRAEEAKQQEVLKQQLDEKAAETAAAIARAEVAEKSAADLQAQVQNMEAAIAAAGTKVQEANRKLEDEDQRYTEALAGAGADIDPCERFKHNCETQKRLGLKPKSAPCDCN